MTSLREFSTTEKSALLKCFNTWSAQENFNGTKNIKIQELEESFYVIKEKLEKYMVSNRYYCVSAFLLDPEEDPDVPTKKYLRVDTKSVETVLTEDCLCDAINSLTEKQFKATREFLQGRYQRSRSPNKIPVDFMVVVLDMIFKYIKQHFYQKRSYLNISGSRMRDIEVHEASARTTSYIQKFYDLEQKILEQKRAQRRKQAKIREDNAEWQDKMANYFERQPELKKRKIIFNNHGTDVPLWLCKKTKTLSLARLTMTQKKSCMSTVLVKYKSVQDIRANYKSIAPQILKLFQEEKKSKKIVKTEITIDKAFKKVTPK